MAALAWWGSPGKLRASASRESVRLLTIVRAFAVGQRGHTGLKPLGQPLLKPRRWTFWWNARPNKMCTIRDRTVSRGSSPCPRTRGAVAKSFPVLDRPWRPHRRVVFPAASVRIQLEWVAKTSMGPYDSHPNDATVRPQNPAMRAQHF